MIKVTRLNKSELVINADLIENIEATPDTVITLTTGRKLVVLEPPQVIVDRVIRFKQKCQQRYGESSEGGLVTLE